MSRPEFIDGLNVRLFAFPLSKYLQQLILNRSPVAKENDVLEKSLNPHNLTKFSINAYVSVRLLYPPTTNKPSPLRTFLMVEFIY